VTAAVKQGRLGLSVLLGLQIVCALFFLADVTYDLLGLGEFLGPGHHLYVEMAIVVGLVFGIVFVSLEINRVLQRQQRMEDQLKAASGAFAEVLAQHFEHWALTPAERDVALFTIKGLSISEIARVRQTREGTIKAQCNAIYRKAGVSGRTQLLSLFIDQLMTESLIDDLTA
jgi:DNA-binding CsgD family transcriptional regulator